MVEIERFRPLYGLEPDQTVFWEVGLESKTDIDREIWDNVALKSSLGLFAAFNNPDLPDLLWENVIAMQVNRWLSVNLQADALYDRDISKALQMKEVLSLGISFILL